MASATHGVVDLAIFENLQLKIDEDAKVREQVRLKLQDLEKQGKWAALRLLDLTLLNVLRKNNAVHLVSRTFDTRCTA